MVLLIDVPSLLALGWEAWGGVALLVAVGASSATWRVRPSGVASSRAAGFAVVAGVGFAVGGLARLNSPFPLVILLALAALSLEPDRNRLSRLAGILVLVFAAVAGFAAQPWATTDRLAQIGGGFALGGALATLRAPGPEGGSVLARVACVFAGVGAAAWTLP